MSFEHLLALEHLRLAPQYAARHTEHPELAAHPTLPLLVAKLTRTPKRLTRDQLDALRRERAAILCALLEAYQRGFDRLWEALVLTALTPMLSIVRTRFTGGDAEEREGLFLAGVSPVIRTLDPRHKPDKIFAIVWMKTKKRVTARLRREQEWGGVGFDVEADRVADEAMPQPEEFVIVDIASHANGGATVRGRVPVGVLALSPRQIEAYVAREFECLPAADQRAVYLRLRALKERCKGLEGKTAPRAPHARTPRRRQAAPPVSQTHPCGDAPSEPFLAQEVAS